MTHWLPTEKKVDHARERTLEFRNGDRQHWRQIRERLIGEGIAPIDAVLAMWQGEGAGVMFALIASRDGRLFATNMHFGYPEGGGNVPDDVGRIHTWRELDPEETHYGEAMTPNTYGMAAILARLVFERERLP